MKIKFLNIIEGWSKSIGLWNVSEETKKVSIARMTICSECPFAEQSEFLKLARGEENKVLSLVCTKCHCPVNEKTLVTGEQCPIKKW